MRHLSDLAVAATSPDGRVWVQVRGDTVEVLLRPGTYRRYTEAELATRLGQVTALALTRYRQIVAAATKSTVDGQTTPT